MEALDSTEPLSLLELCVIFRLPFPTEQFNSINCEMCFDGLPFPLNIACPEGVDTLLCVCVEAGLCVGESGGVLTNVS